MSLSYLFNCQYPVCLGLYPCSYDLRMIRFYDIIGCSKRESPFSSSSAVSFAGSILIGMVQVRSSSFNLLQTSYPVHLWHLDSKQDKIRRIISGRNIPGLRPIGSNQEAVVVFEQAGQGLDIDLFIIHN